MIAVLFFTLILAALVSFAFGWDRWSLAAPAPDARHWRHTAGGIACLIVAAQAINPLAFLLIASSSLGRDTEVLRLWALNTPLLFILGGIFLMASKGSARWYLLLSSCLFFVLSFFTMPAVLD